MSRWRGLIVALGATCALSATAAAVTLEDAVLKGPIEKGGRAEIMIGSGRIDGTPVNRYRMEFRRISVRCSGRRETARLPVEDEFWFNAEYDRVGESWGISGTTSVGPWGDYNTKVGGRLVSRQKARGWVRVYGTDVAIRGGGRHEDCDSGRLRWVARSRD